MHDVIGSVAALVVAAISALGYGGVIALMAVESACIPLPSEVIMTFAGYLVSTGRFDLLLVATAGAIGCNLGSTVAYIVGYAGGRGLVQRYGGWVLLDGEAIERAERFFARYGGGAVLIGRLLPVVRTFISLPAGFAGMGQMRFQIYSFIGSWPWCLLLAYVGYRLGQRWDSDPRLKSVMHRLDLAVALLLVAAVAWYARHLWRRRVGAQARVRG